MESEYHPDAYDLNDGLTAFERERLKQEIQGGYGNTPLLYDGSGEPLLLPPDDEER